MRNWRQHLTLSVPTICLAVLIFANALLSFFHNTREVQAAPLLQFSTPINVSLRIYEWDGNFPSTRQCSLNSTDPGCTALERRPFPPSQPAIVNINQFYLLDVVSKETPPDEFPDSSLKAQAVAARSFVYWHIDRGVAIDSRTQAFIPYTFERIQSNITLTTPNNPCASSNIDSTQSRICSAVSGGEYMTSDIDSRPIYAAYILDIPEATSTYPDTSFGRNSYLVGVNEPISPNTGGCGVQQFSFTYGMSQKGLGRWARGNYCYTGNPDRPYNVPWDRWEQLLVHYYTRIDIRNSSGNVIAPNYRWNPLRVQWSTTSSANPPSNIPVGGSRLLTVDVQNTGTVSWLCSNGITYQLRGRLLNTGLSENAVTFTNTLCLTSTQPSLTPGSSRSEVLLPIRPPSNLVPGSYILEIDVIQLENGSVVRVFSNASQNPPFPSWPAIRQRLCIDCGRRAYLPNLNEGPPVFPSLEE